MSDTPCPAHSLDTTVSSACRVAALCPPSPTSKRRVGAGREASSRGAIHAGSNRCHKSTQSISGKYLASTPPVFAGGDGVRRGRAASWSHAVRAHQAVWALHAQTQRCSPVDQVVR